MNQYQVPGVVSACRILQLLTQSKEGYTMHEIGDKLCIPRTTLFRLLKTLCSEQMIEKKGKLYLPGVALTRMGLHMLNTDHLHHFATPHMQTLALESGYTAHLAVPNNQRSLIVEVVDSPNPLMVSKRPGVEAELYCSSTGKVFLAFLYRDMLDDILAFPLHAFTENTVTDVIGLAAELKKVEAQGYAIDNKEYNAHVRCLAVPVRDNRGVVVAALGVTAPDVSFPESRIPDVATLVKNAASRIYRDAYQLKTKPAAAIKTNIKE